MVFFVAGKTESAAPKPLSKLQLHPFFILQLQNFRPLFDRELTSFDCNIWITIYLKMFARLTLSILFIEMF